MAEGILLDNDVVLKICAYQLGDELLACTTFDGVGPAILAVARFSMRGAVKRKRLLDVDGATAELDSVVARLRIVEPDDGEIAFAAELEERAIAQSLELDSGESQLFAILVQRSARLLATGDKRAVSALAQIAAGMADGRLGCLEQLIGTFVVQYGHSDIRSSICREPAADKAITLCFGCSHHEVAIEGIIEGLSSYINHLRAETGALLCANSDLSAIVA